MSTVTLEIQNHIATITINRPDSYNAFNKEAGELFIDYLKQVSHHEDVYVVAITGSGKAFCSGQDLVEVTDPDSMPGFKSLLADRYNVIVRLIDNMPKPVIGLVNGVAAGAGANIALACDITLAKESALFVQAFSSIGLVPDSGGSYFLPRLIGLNRAMGIVMMADKIDGKSAASMGMIYKAIPDELWQDESQQILSKLAALPPVALARTKQLMRSSMHNNLDQQLDIEEEHQILCSETLDYREGVQAFLQKRKPVFIGK